MALLLVGSIYEVQARKISTETPIKHVIVIVQENHTFFNYFGAFPGVQGGISSGVCMPENPQNTSCISPHETNDSMLGIRCCLAHGEVAAQTAYDNGSMDGFLEANDDNPDVMAYYNNTVLGYYWGLASNYTLFDNFFSSYLSYSLPNHWAAVAGVAPKVSIGSHLSQSNASTEELIQQASEIGTMLELIQKYPSISVKYYDEPVRYDSITQAIEEGGDKYIVDYFNPSLAKADTYTTLRPDFVNRTSIFSDIASGNLPSVSWVIPNLELSEHPPDNITLGEQWVQSVIDAVMSSKYWSSTAIFYVTDDWGGFYDPVAPPTLDGQLLGFRVAAMLISPYANRGVDHAQYSFESILHFIDYNWNLNSHFLNQRVADSNNMLGAFNFDQAALRPWLGTPLTLAQMRNVISNASLNTPDID
ncbi:MAG TPA: alkaline phosphatase family protein [Nitrososphaerales archaeon]|nr:alkaline phosphatase family protein [Nitrososphaerales archaeon]